MADSHLVKLVKKAQRNPNWWMHEACGWGLWKRQREIMSALIKHERVAVPASFGVGKTYLGARAALWWLFNHRDAKVITTAPTLRQVKDLLWSELRSAHGRSRRPLGGEPLKLRLELDHEWYAVGFATDADKVDQFTGYHSPHMLVIFDQAAGLPNGTWQGAEGLMTGGHARWLALSNTTDASSVMAEISTGEVTQYGKWHVEKITAYDSPNVVAKCDLIPGIISHDWIEKKRLIWEPNDPMWQIFVEANFVDEAHMVFLTGSMIRGMMERDIAPDWNHIVIGLDVADEGLDSTVWTVRAGPRLLFIEQSFGNDPMQVVQKTRQVWDRVRSQTGRDPHVICVDKIGIGSGVTSRLQEMGYNAMGINVSTSPRMDEEQFLNLRAEMGWTIRRLAEDGKMSLKPLYQTPPQLLDTLKAELTLRYRILSSGKIQMESKDDIRKRLQRSPDFWDSMMLCYADAYQPPDLTTLQLRSHEDAAFEAIKGKPELTLDEALVLMRNASDDDIMFDQVEYVDDDTDDHLWSTSTDRTVFW